MSTEIKTAPGTFVLLLDFARAPPYLRKQSPLWVIGYVMDFFRYILRDDYVHVDHVLIVFHAWLAMCLETGARRSQLYYILVNASD